MPISLACYDLRGRIIGGRVRVEWGGGGYFLGILLLGTRDFKFLDKVLSSGISRVFVL